MLSLCSSDAVNINDEQALVSLYEEYLNYREKNPKCPILPEDDEDLAYEKMVLARGSKEEKERLLK